MNNELLVNVLEDPQETDEKVSSTDRAQDVLRIRLIPLILCMCNTHSQHTLQSLSKIATKTTEYWKEVLCIYCWISTNHKTFISTSLER